MLVPAKSEAGFYESVATLTDFLFCKRKDFRSFKNFGSLKSRPLNLGGTTRDHFRPNDGVIFFV